MRRGIYIGLLFLSAISVVIGYNSGQPRLLKIAIYPGDNMPLNRKCDYIPYDVPQEYCQVMVDGERVYLEGDRASGKVTSVTHHTNSHAISIGDLMLQWGNPDSSIRVGRSWRLVWKHSSALVKADPFTPFSSVVTWTLYSKEQRQNARFAWRGFRRL